MGFVITSSREPAREGMAVSPAGPGTRGGLVGGRAGGRTGRGHGRPTGCSTPPAPPRGYHAAPAHSALRVSLGGRLRPSNPLPAAPARARGHRCHRPGRGHCWACAARGTPSPAPWGAEPTVACGRVCKPEGLTSGFLDRDNSHGSKRASPRGHKASKSQAPRCKARGEQGAVEEEKRSVHAAEAGSSQGAVQCGAAPGRAGPAGTRHGQLRQARRSTCSRGTDTTSCFCGYTASKARGTRAPCPGAPPLAARREAPLLTAHLVPPAGPGGRAAGRLGPEQSGRPRAGCPVVTRPRPFVPPPACLWVGTGRAGDGAAPSPAATPPPRVVGGLAPGAARPRGPPARASPDQSKGATRGCREARKPLPTRVRGVPARRVSGRWGWSRMTRRGGRGHRIAARSRPGGGAGGPRQGPPRARGPGQPGALHGGIPAPNPTPPACAHASSAAVTPLLALAPCPAPRHWIRLPVL